MESEFNPNFTVTDMSTIHEAYQFLVKTYVEEAKNRKENAFLSIEEIRKKNEARRNSIVADPASGANSRAGSRAGSRRGSFVGKSKLSFEILR